MSFRAVLTVLVAPLLLAACGDAGVLGPEPPALPEHVSEAFRLDAMRLLLREYQSQGSLRERPIELPEADVNLQLRPLAWLYHATQVAARDTVLDIYQVHAFPRPELYAFILTVDDRAPWVSEWREGRRLTGNLQLDSLTARYEVDLVSYRTSGVHQGSVLLRTGKPLNIEALGAAYENADGVLASYPNTPGGDGADLTMDHQAGGWELTFSVAWGDCFAGCTERHYWRFAIEHDGAVQYLDGWGSDLAGYGVAVGKE